MISWRLLPGPEGLVATRHPEEVATLAEAAFFLPHGAYTTLRTYGATGVLLLDQHMDRLEESAGLMGCSVQLDRAGVRRALGGIVHSQRGETERENRLRLTVDCSAHPGELWLSMEPLPLLAPDLYEQGVAVVTQTMQRANPRAKDNAFLTTTKAERARISGRINEVLMVGTEGEVLEGLSSNFFGIRAGTLYTAEEGILPGLTRSLILEEAAQGGIPVRLESLQVGALSGLDEAFISSSSRAVLPVVEMDGQVVGNGQPGSITREISRRYDARVQQEIEWL
ncbi:MAG: aminotransferase class IV [Ardenticatenales bacterium]|nr:aminotransferase class IV [Ardenticatenales bacterium]